MIDVFCRLAEWDGGCRTRYHSKGVTWRVETSGAMEKWIRFMCFVDGCWGCTENYSLSGNNILMAKPSNSMHSHPCV